MNLEQYTQYLPEAVGLASYAIGVKVDNIANRKANADRQALIEEWGLDDPQVQLSEPSRIERSVRFFDRYASYVALSLGVTAFLTTAIFVHITESKDVKPAAIEVVVDHSGATGLRIGSAQPIAPEIDQIADDFVSNSHIVSNAFVASFSSVTETNVSKVDSMAPSGDAPLDTALVSALNATGLDKEGKKTKSDSVVVITNGNYIGSPSAVISESKAQGYTPVYVVNVEGAQATSTQYISEYEQIVSGTKAKHPYWNANSKNINTVAQEVENTLTPAEHEQNKSNPNRNLFIFGALFSGLAFTQAFRSRRRGVVQSNNVEGK